MMNNNTIYADVAIIGGGASGLTAAIFAARKNKNRKIIILEAQDRVGKKILVTGNGKCNLLNENISTENYNFDAQNFLKPIIKEYSYKKILDFFTSLGLLTKTDSEGRIYPYCEQASSVLDVLRLECKRLGVVEFCNFNINEIKHQNNSFLIQSNEYKVLAKKVIFSTGGSTFFNKSLFENSYKILKQFKHTFKIPLPSLVPIKTDSGFESHLKGIRAPAEVKLIDEKNLICKTKGEIQFTDKGLSGICIFQISRLVSEFLKFKTIKGKKTKNLIISIDLLPTLSLKKVEELLKNRALMFKNEPLECLFTGIINKKFYIPIFKSANVFYKGRVLQSISKEEILKIAQIIKDFQFKPVDVMPLKNAQVMSGGINLCEVNNLTLESLKIKNLYITGELLNVDGDCGGYNLYWAWTSGMIAGNSV